MPQFTEAVLKFDNAQLEIRPSPSPDAFHAEFSLSQTGS